MVGVCDACLCGALLLFAGIRDMLPLFEALPLCGAAVTFFAAAKKVTKESRFTPPSPRTNPPSQRCVIWSTGPAALRRKPVIQFV